MIATVLAAGGWAFDWWPRTVRAETKGPIPGSADHWSLSQKNEATALQPSGTGHFQQRAPLRIDPIPQPDPDPEPRYYPGFNAATPSGFGADWGDVFIGASVVDREKGMGALKSGKVLRSDIGQEGGSAAVGFGLGDAKAIAGLETVYNIISLTPSRFASNGSVDFKLHRRLGRLFSMALGWESAIHYGPQAGDTSSSTHATLSVVIPLRPANTDHPLLVGLSGGIGDGRFRKIDDQVEGRDNLGGFGSVGLQVLSNVSVIAERLGSGYNIGVCYVPFTRLPFFLSGTAIDVTDQTGFGVRYVASAAFGYHF